MTTVRDKKGIKKQLSTVSKYAEYNNEKKNQESVAFLLIDTDKYKNSYGHVHFLAANRLLQNTYSKKEIRFHTYFLHVSIVYSSAKHNIYASYS